MSEQRTGVGVELWIAAAARGGLQLMGQSRPAHLRVPVRLPPLGAVATAGGARQKTTRRRPDLAGKIEGWWVPEFGRTSLPPLLVVPPLLQASNVQVQALGPSSLLFPTAPCPS